MPVSIKHYDQLKKIKQFRHGIIYRARDSKTKKYVTLKRIFIAYNEDILKTDYFNKNEGIPPSIIAEISLLQQLSDNKHIIKLHDIVFESDSNTYCSDLYLSYEHFECNLKSYLNKYAKSLSIKQIKHYIHQILSGISYCHSLKIIHGDMKPQNILIEQHSQQIKIGGFGSRLNDNNIQDLNLFDDGGDVVWYQSPEVLLGIDKYMQSMDIWSIGCILVEILNYNKVLCPGNSSYTQLMLIFKLFGTPCNDPYFISKESKCKWFQHSFPKWTPKSMKKICPRVDLDENGLDFLSKLLVINPTKRITSKSALRHKWVQTYV